MSQPSKAVFLSYASQDAEAARRICEALRAAGIEVWFDQSELRGGDVWDRQIRKQIHDCALFVPIISRNTQARLEGYFRREWKLAVARMFDMADEKPFLLPIVVDDADDASASVPEQFRAVQWTRLTGADIPQTFVERVAGLLSSGEVIAPRAAQPLPSLTPPALGARGSAAPAPSAAGGRPGGVRAVLVAVLAVGALAIAYVAYQHFATSKQAAASVPALVQSVPTAAAPAQTTPSAAPAAFSPPPHSIAVLPFVNMSGNPKEDYFSDGLSEELLNSLSRVSALQVAARTSSFSFKGKNVDLTTIAHQLGVGAVLEGSVRRSGHKVRVTAQLINAVTGFHLWSETYDRELKDVLALQTEVATAVTQALKVHLLSDTVAQIELGGTRNPRAFDAYLRGQELLRSGDIFVDHQQVLAAFDEAVALDPNFALAEVGRSVILNTVAENIATTDTIRTTFARARAAAERAIALAPDLGEAHARLSRTLTDGFFDFAGAGREIERAIALAPGSVPVQRDYSRYASNIGRHAVAIEAARRAVTLDPLDPRAYIRLGDSFYNARRYEDSASALERARLVDARGAHPDAVAQIGMNYLALGQLERARAACALPDENWQLQTCRAIVLQKLGHPQEAAAQMAKMVKAIGDASAYQYAQIYAQWGDTAQAVTWLERSYELRDPGLVGLKVDPVIDPIRDTPQFKDIEKKLNFPPAGADN